MSAGAVKLLELLLVIALVLGVALRELWALRRERARDAARRRGEDDAAG